MKKKLQFACSITLSSLLLFAVNAKPGVNRYTEDFTTKQYCDTFSTTALWDTVAGEIKLPPFDLTLAGSVNTPGYARNVVVSGDYAYVGALSLVQVIDISDPTAPSIVGDYNTPGYAWNVAIAGDYAYVADEGTGLQVLDISVPTSPTSAGSYDTPGQAYGVTISGDYAYVADFTSGLHAIDISDPINPTLAGTYDTPSYALGVAVAGDHAYVADYTAGLQVVDISDPTNLSLAGSYDTPGNAWVVVISGNYAYLADANPGLQVIDISDPTSPTLAGSYDTPDAAYNVVISGDYAYVADQVSGLQLLDISDPTSPSLIGGYDTAGDALGVALSGEHAFVALYGVGIEVIDISDAVGPSLVGTYDTPGMARGIALAGDYAYVADFGLGLQVIDVTVPSSPSIAGNIDTPNAAFDVAVSGDYAYVADEASGLQVIDISDPTNPSIAGSYDTPGWALSVAISGDHAYVADSFEGLQVIDIGDPANPSLAGSAATPTSAHDVTVSGDYAYVAMRSAGVHVFDVSDPTAPSLAGSYAHPGHAYGVAISGDYAYVAASIGGLRVLDITDPTNPSLAGSYDTPSDALKVSVSGDYAYLAGTEGGLLVIDISDPTNPLPAGSYDTPDRAWDIAVAGDFVFVGDEFSGLQVIQVQQHAVGRTSATAYSTVVASSSEDILSVRLSTTQTDSIAWYIFSGTNYQLVPSDGSWTGLSFPMNFFAWASQLEYENTVVNPICSELVIEWLGETPILDTIVDIPNDQGRQVSISWTKSGYDFVGSQKPIVEYAIFRKIDYELTTFPQSYETASEAADTPPSGNGPPPEPAYPPGDWHYVMTVPARAEGTYSTVVPTLADSTIIAGMYYTTFFVRARTATPGMHFDTEPDSGYSVDNLAPLEPQGFSVAYNSGGGTDLVWEECPDADFQYFRIYRDESEDFTPDPGNLVEIVIGATWHDDVAEGYKYFYKVTSVDFSGNESDATGPGTVTGVAGDATPQRFALHQNVPNPFNPTTTISYDVPGNGTRFTLQIFDVSGRLVKTLVDGAQSAGSRSASWDGTDRRGHRVATGVYFYRMAAGEFVQTRKMVLMK